MRVLIIILLSLLVVLQFKLWFGDGGLLEVRQLRQSIAAQQEENERLREELERAKAVLGASHNVIVVLVTGNPVALDRCCPSTTLVP